MRTRTSIGGAEVIIEFTVEGGRRTAVVTVRGAVDPGDRVERVGFVDSKRTLARRR